MNFKHLQKIQKILKLTRALKELKAIMRVVDEDRKKCSLQKWYSKHNELIESMSPAELDQISEKTDYDKEEWLKIVQQFQ